ncbi:hypothetical protein HJP15_08550 [Pseudoalteromonas sp. NEC-BIFX-2020_002]|uniref:substrate-binding domain-containing protein n=1 Tax=Pseudoalteromonas sp. NEC-BIFX-2020_002 TaxID=2732353 RepID=UPI001476A295|nr:substrate-binding domain-containing protein [Pseudoalteromonas sp. NEC-BIFX-2020_002]NNG42961.1 hypothetical protein [Pseudoalteromonas sp. NEC-BIFX-2020_002]
MIKHLLLVTNLFFCVAASSTQLSNLDTQKLDTQQPQTILVAGSTSVVQMLELVQADFNNTEQSVMQLRGMGSDKGIQAIGENLVDIGASSRYMTKAEQERWPNLKQTVLAQDALVFFTNIENPIKNLSTEQLSDIYRGKYTLWSQVSGKNTAKSEQDNQIHLFSKGIQHGTFDVFLEFLNLDYMKSAQPDAIKFKSAGNRGLFSKQDVALYNEFNQALGIVQRIPNAIAFDSFGAVSQLKNSKLIDKIRILSINDVSPTQETVKTSHYNFVRPLVLIVNTQSAESVKKGKLISDFLKTKDIRELLTSHHYIMVD